MKLSQIFLSYFFFVSYMIAGDITPSTNHKTAFALPKNMVTVDGSINYLDKDIDLFNSIKKDAKHDYGYIGKLTGSDLTIGYGIHKHISVFYNFKASKMDYFNTKLTNIHNEIFARVNFYDVPNYIFDVFTLDIGLIRDASDDLNIDDAQSFVSFTRKIKPGLGGVSQSNGHILYKGEVLSDQIDPGSGKKIDTKYKISDLSNNSFYLRFLWGNRFSNALLNLYTGIKYSDISTSISLSPKKSANQLYNEFLKSYGNDIDLGRNEKSLFGGINFIFESENFIYDLNYEYNRLFSRGNIGLGSNNNSIFDINIAYKANRELLIYFGGRAMLKSYNAVIPYLYNQFTQEKFDDRYGYVKLGFIYNFNYDLIDRKSLF